LLIAALLAIVAVAVPRLGDESLSSLLFLAGAGLVAAVLWTPSPSLSAEARAAAPSTPRSLRPAVAPSLEQKCFAELTSLPRTAPALDRARWARLTAHMSHELRTPLNAVLGFSEMMSGEVFGPLGSSCYTAYARDIHASGRMLLKSAEDALAITTLLTSPDRETPQTCGLKTAADDACAFARDGLGTRSVAIVADVDSIDVVGDRQATRQMLINLISEAAGTARNGATLVMKTGCTADTVRLSLRIAAESIEAALPDDRFSMILTRTLCELSGARLTCGETSEGDREWAVYFLPVAQSDLFYSGNRI
jgi:two-component system cell cycle sensor histidine kinase PleC